MLSNLKKEDFEVLRGPLESGRQSPASLSPMLLLSVFLQPLMLMLTYVVAADASIFPYKEIMFVIHLIITGLIIILSIFFAIPSVYKKHQITQYLVTILMSQNLLGVFVYLMALFFIGKERNISEESLLTFTFISLFVGLLIFVTTCIRFYILLKRGQYRKGTKRDVMRSETEFKVKSHLPMIMIASIGLVFFIRYLVNIIGWNDIETIMLILLGISIYFVMLFVLPEQLVILYCKYRFESFNFNKNGELKPMGRKSCILQNENT